MVSRSGAQTVFFCGALAGCTPVLESPTQASACGEVDNAWPAVEPPAELVGGSLAVGAVAPDVCLTDQNGQQVSLWQFYGSVIVIDVSTMWCGPCQQLAEEVCQVQADYADQGFAYLTLMPQNNIGEVPSQDDLNSWVSDFGVDCAPVLSDDQGYTDPLVPGGVFPALALIGRDMTVLTTAITPAEDTTIRAAIEAAL